MSTSNLKQSSNDYDLGCKRASSILLLILTLASLMAVLLILLESKSGYIPIKQPMLNFYRYSKSNDVVTHNPQTSIIKTLYSNTTKTSLIKNISVHDKLNYQTISNKISTKSIVSNSKLSIKQVKQSPKNLKIEYSNRKKPKIAYVFAGSARSFVCPKVHWSLKVNLIDALGGAPYVFIRMALEDNINTRTGFLILNNLNFLFL